MLFTVEKFHCHMHKRERECFVYLGAQWQMMIGNIDMLTSLGNMSTKINAFHDRSVYATFTLATAINNEKIKVPNQI